MLLKRLFAACLALSLFGIPSILAATFPPEPIGYVNDFAHVLSEQTVQQLEENLRAYEQQTTHEISVVTLDQLPDDRPIEDVANQLFRDWGIGKKEKNNGVLFLLAIQERKMRIEVGYGLEGDLTDIETKAIQDDEVRPYLRDNDYDQGITLGVKDIEHAISGNFVSEQSMVPSTITQGSEDEFFWLIFFSIASLIFCTIILSIVSTKAPKEKRYMRVMLVGIALIVCEGIIFWKLFGQGWYAEPQVMQKTLLRIPVFGFQIFFLIFVSTVFQTISFFLGRSKSWWLGGVLGAALGGVIGWFLLPAAFGHFRLSPVLLLGALGALFDYRASQGFKSGDTWWKYIKRHGRGGRGGFGGGSSGFGSSSGGFGGGSSGGGGSSSSW